MRNSIWCFVVGLLALASCTTTKVIERDVEVRSDTLHHYTERRDSIHRIDSVYTYVKGDTLIQRETHYYYVGEGRVDTVRTVQYVTNEKEVEKTVEVERQKTWWEKTCQYIGIASFIVLALLIAYKIKKWQKK